MLTTVELIIHVCGEAFERLLAVILGHATFDVQNLAHQVNDRVIKVEHDHHSVGTSLLGRLLEILRGLNFIIDTVVDATAADQRLKLDSQHCEGIRACHDAVVGSIVVGQLTLPAQLVSVLKPVVV